MNDLIDQYKRLHKTNPKYGHSGSRNLPLIEKYAQKHGVESILDYGCGKGNIIKKLRAKGYKVEGYDPGVPEYSELPNRQFDMVISTDVFEHIPPQDVPEELGNALCRAAKVAVFVIALRYDRTNKLPDGSNPHKTVKPVDWWVNKINHVFDVMGMKPENENFPWEVSVPAHKEGYEATIVIQKKG